MTPLIAPHPVQQAPDHWGAMFSLEMFHVSVASQTLQPALL